MDTFEEDKANFIKQLEVMVEARKAIAAKQPTVACTFCSEAEITLALSRMNSDAAEAVRILETAYKFYPKEIYNAELFRKQIELAMLKAITKYGKEQVSNYNILCFMADHELEIYRVVVEIIMFRLRGTGLSKVFRFFKS